MSAKILVIEDDADVRMVVSLCLKTAGFDVVAVENGNRLNYLMNNQGIELAIVDLGLPGEDGLSLVRRMRDNARIGIIILTAQAEPVDRVVGLELGADDYLTKPFEPRELVARVRAVLRRTSNPAEKPGTATAVQIFRWAGWEFDTGTQSLVSPDGNFVTLTGGEVRLLIAFLSHPNWVLSRDQIIEMISSDDTPAFDRSIDVRIARLRKKLQNEDPKTSFIHTIRNYGYQFSAKLDRN